jgi:parvulin-like peptidyl-prolyl isomerase
VRLLREPLLHFLLLGAALFLLYELFGARDADRGRQAIVVGAGEIEHLRQDFARTRARPPTEVELEGLIEDFIREEVLSREARALGLDRNDGIIRRRLRQKMELVAEESAPQSEPTDEELRAYLAAHPESFRVEQRFSFRQVHLNPRRHGDALPGDVERLLAELNESGAAADIENLGDSLILETDFPSASRDEVARTFGEEFTARLARLEPGRWQGPVPSAYGVHLVFLRERTEGRLPSLEEAREAARREWSNARRLEAHERLYQELRRRHPVTIERRETTGESRAALPEPR